MNSSAIEEGGGLTQRKKQETSFDVVDRVEKLDEPKQYVGYGEVYDFTFSIYEYKMIIYNIFIEHFI